MKNKNKFFAQVPLISLFLLGNMIISFPKGNGMSQSLLGFFACVLLSLSFSAFYIKLSCHERFGVDIFKPEQNGIFTKSIIFALFFIFCLICWLICCKDYTLLVDTLRLKSTSRIIISAVFCSLSLFLAFCKPQTLKMLAKVTFFIVGLCIVIMFISSIKTMRFSLFKGILPISFNNLFRQALTFYIHSFGQIFIVLLFYGRMKKKQALKTQMYGLHTSSALYFICLAQVLLVLGTNILNELSFPYSAATGSIMSGETYARADGLTYYIYFICSLIKASVILITILKSAEKIHPAIKKATAVFFFISGIIFSSANSLIDLLQSDMLNLILLIFEIFFPIVFYIFMKKSNSNQQARHR